MSSPSLITDVFADPNTDLTYPIIRFEYGLIAEEDIPNLESKIYSSGDDENTVVMSNGKRQYKGTYKLNGGEWNRNYLLIRNKRTNQVQIVQTAQCVMGSIHKKDSKKSVTEDQPVVEATPQDYKDLTRVFGSKKQKRQSHLYEKLNASLKNDMEMREAVSNVSITNESMDSILGEGEENILRLLPPCNRQATTPEEVYPVSDILSEREMKALMETADYLLQNQNEFPKGSHLASLVASLKDLSIEVTSEKMVFLLFVDSLLKYLQVSAVELKSKKVLDQICPFSSLLASRILTDFTTLSSHTRARPLFFKDKAVCYIMILLCLAGDYSVSLNTITTCIKKMSNKKLMQLAKIVGLVPSKFGSRTLTLKVPLPELQVAPPQRRNNKTGRM